MKTLKSLILSMFIVAAMFVLFVIILQSGSAKDTTEAYLEIERIDGCEYITHKYSSSSGIVHHGACDNH